MDEARIKSLIAELDSAVPKQGAVVKLLKYGGGPDESAFAGNMAGYLRFGIEFLKGAFASTGADAARNDDVRVDLDYVLDRTSDISFDWFQRGENLPGVTSPEQATWKQRKLAPALAIAFLCVCGVVFVVGLVTIFRSLI